MRVDTSPLARARQPALSISQIPCRTPPHGTGEDKTLRGAPAVFDNRAIGERAKRLRSKPLRVYFETTARVRYSSRQDRKIGPSGFTGAAELEALPDAPLPCFCWGELLHVGMASAFGLGKHRFEASSGQT